MPVRVFLVFLTFFLSCNAFVPNQSASEAVANRIRTDKVIQDNLRQLNKIRRTAGLDTVSIAPGISEGCFYHANYLVRNENHKLVKDLSAHDEYEELHGYTRAGANAGGNSVISFGNPDHAINHLMATFYHRISLIDPNLKRVGYGYVRYNGRKNAVTVIDVRSGNSYSRYIECVAYPADGQKNIPRLFQNEIPAPFKDIDAWTLGYPVTFTFHRNINIDSVKITFTSGKQYVPFYFSTPDNPGAAGKDYQQNTICVVSRRYLSSKTKYTVTLNCLANDSLFIKKISFTTE